MILCVPFRNQSETLHNLRDALRPGQLARRRTVPLAAAVGGKATRTLGVWQGSAAQQAQEMVPEGVTVVSALHTVSAASLRDLDHALDEDVLLCGDRRADKAPRGGAASTRSTACAASTAGGWRWRASTEQLTALMISINVALQDARRREDHRRCPTSCGRRAVMAEPRSSCSPAAPAARSSRAGCSTSSATT